MSTRSMDPSLRQPTDMPTGLTIDQEVRKHIAISDCSSAGSAWRAAGTLSNPDSTSHTYDLTVFFTTLGATVVAHSSTRLTVGAGGSASWQGDVANKTHGPLSCVLTGVAQH
ncbi:hypothetical protein [Mesorhizobium japonicum]|uniref:hypothetical protein n=1 Tax=Mesorhizobium japonicum TaxID=2066070 RepID=UPI003B58C6D7